MADLIICIVLLDIFDAFSDLKVRVIQISLAVTTSVAIAADTALFLGVHEAVGLHEEAAILRGS